MHDHHDAGVVVEDRPRVGSALRVGVGGPVGTGKTALVGAVCAALRDEWSICVVTNDIFTTADADALRARGVLDADRIVPVETGCCPHTAVRDDVSANLDAVEALEERFRPDLVLIESGGDNLTLTWSRALVDRQIFVLDTAGGDDVPGKGGPGTVQSDLLVINKTDLAPHVGADLGRMERDARARRGERPLLLTSVRRDGGIDPVVARLRAWASG
ncbi:MAG: urease accessory protein UreG [Actinomycetota bacterium]